MAKVRNHIQGRHILKMFYFFSDLMANVMAEILTIAERVEIVLMYGRHGTTDCVVTGQFLNELDFVGLEIEL